MKTHLNPFAQWLRPLAGRWLAPFLGLGLLGTTATDARAATLVVTNAADSGAGSLRATIAAAVAGDTIIFAPTLNGQTISLIYEQLVIAKNLTILGPGPGLLTINRGSFQNPDNQQTNSAAIRIFKITSNSPPHTVTIAGLTIEDGVPNIERVGDDHGGGGIFNDAASLTVSNCVFRNNNAGLGWLNGDASAEDVWWLFWNSGGGAICNRLGTLHVTQCVLSNNSASTLPVSMGGAIYNQQGVVNIDDSIISDNTSNDAGLYGGWGGGLCNRAGVMTLTNCTLVGNTSGRNGGFGRGGAIVNGGYLAGRIGWSTLIVSGCILSGNTANIGAGIFSTDGSATVTSSLLFSNNVASSLDGDSVDSRWGGAIFVSFGNLTVNDSTFMGNRAGNAGGGIAYMGAFDPGLAMEINNSTFIGNTVTGDGPSTASPPEYGGGGGIYIDEGPIARLNNCTLSGNSAINGGGICFRESNMRGAVTLNNSIVAGNTAGGTGPDILTHSDYNASEPKLVSNGHNFIGTTNGIGSLPPVFTDMTFANTRTTLGQLIATNAQGRPLLANQGGPTPTVALPAGSRAIDAGANSNALTFAYDQRGPGFPRLYNLTVDIGAFEFTPRPEIAVLGNGVSISDGDTAPGTADGTDFGSMSVSTGTVVRTFTITNLGNRSLNLTGTPPVVVSGVHAADFAVSLPPASPVATNGSTTFQVRFDPRGAGLRTATLSIPNDDLDENPYNFSIQGTGVDPEVSITGNGITILDGDTTPGVADGTDFGSTAVSSGTVVRSFTITNLGTAPLVLSGVPKVAVSGPNAVDFTVNVPPASPVATNGASTFQVTFDPSLTGPRRATLSITNSDLTGGENVYTFAILGTGTGPCSPAITVLNANDSYAGSLRQALVDICPGGTINFAPALKGQAIVLTSGGLVLRTNVTILGPGATNLTIRGNGGSRVFTINSGVSGVLAGLTIANGAGGIRNSGTLTVSNCAVSGHSAFDEGGGIRNVGTLTLLNSTISGNESAGDEGGGGLHNSGAVTIENSTISGNSAPGPGIGPTGRGGGLYNFSGNMTLRHTTVAGNSANSRGDGIFLRAGTLSVSHTLLSNAGENYAIIGGSVSNGGFNLASDGSAAAFAGNAGNLRLGALAFNGGPTRTHALASSSPAIDAGTTNTLPNAWQIADVSAVNGSGVLAYTRALTPVQKTISTNSGWQYTVVSRLVEGSGGGSPAHYMIHGNGTRRFFVAWDTNAAGELVATLSGGITTNLTTADDATNYHTHELIYDPATRQATYRFDGSNIVTWAGLNDANQNGLVQWGSASSFGRGRMNYHHVRFDINGLGNAAEYFAGYRGSQLVTPHPTNQNWTLNLPAVAGTVTNAPVSPDAVALWPDASGDVALDFDQRGFGYSRRAGRAVDVGAFEFQASSVALRFVGIAPLPAGMFLNLQGAPNEVLSIQRNTEPGPVGWQPLTSGATDGSGSLQYIDTSIAGQPKRFYRAVRP